MYVVATLGYVWTSSQTVPSILRRRQGNGKEHVAYEAGADVNMTYMRFLTLHGTQTGWALQHNNSERNAGGRRARPHIASATAGGARPSQPLVRVTQTPVAPKYRGRFAAGGVKKGQWFGNIGNVHVGITHDGHQVVNFAVVVALPRSPRQARAAAEKFTTATVTATQQNVANAPMDAAPDGAARDARPLRGEGAGVDVMDAAPDGGAVPAPQDGVRVPEGPSGRGEDVTVNGASWTVVVTSCGCDMAKARYRGHVRSCWVYHTAMHVGILALRLIHSNDHILRLFTRRRTGGGGAVTVSAGNHNVFVPYFHPPHDTTRLEAVDERLVRALQDCLTGHHNSNNVVHVSDSYKEQIFMTVEWKDGGYKSHLVRINRHHHASCSCSKASSRKGKAPRRRGPLQTDVDAQRVRTGSVCDHVMMCLHVYQQVDVDSDDTDEHGGDPPAGPALPRANKLVYYDFDLGRYIVPGVVTLTSPALCDDRVPDDVCSIRQSRKRVQTNCSDNHRGFFPFNLWDYSQFASVTEMQPTEDAQLLKAQQICGSLDHGIQWETCNNEVLVHMRDGPVVIVVPDLVYVTENDGTHKMLCDCGVLDITRLSANEAVANEVLWDYLHHTGATGTGRGGITITQFWKCVFKTYPDVQHIPPCNPVGFRAIYGFCANLAAGGLCPVGNEASDSVQPMLCPFCGLHPSVLVIDASTAAILGNNAHRTPLVTVSVPKPTQLPPKVSVAYLHRRPSTCGCSYAGPHGRCVS